VIPRFGPRKLRSYLWYAVFYLFLFALLMLVGAFGLVADA
jgi:hypothetical protein